MNVCDMRVSNGMGCARTYGTNYGDIYNRLPSESEIVSHVGKGKGRSAFSDMHWKNIVSEAKRYANHAIAYNRRISLNQAKKQYSERLRELTNALINSPEAKALGALGIDVAVVYVDDTGSAYESLDEAV